MVKVYYIALYLLGISNKDLLNIMEIIPDEEIQNLFTSNIYEIQYKFNINLKKYEAYFEDKDLLSKKIHEAKKIMTKNKELNIKTILYKNKIYPYNLKKIKNPPAIIYIKGKNIIKSDIKSIACVGTRNPSSIGLDMTKALVSKLSRENFTIISGLAYGIDRIAHETCLRENGKTIAVLAHGLDYIYPKEHIEIANDIINYGGTLVSEYPVGTKADKYKFVARNRIISGLCSGLLMIEAKERSGTNHTVNFTLEENKPIFCPEHNIKSEYNGLNFKLLKNNKAIAIKNRDDYYIIVEKLGYSIKNDFKLIEKRKNDSIRKMIMSLGNNNLEININELIKEKAKTGFDVDKETYDKFKMILKENNLSIREFFNIIVRKMVNSD